MQGKKGKLAWEITFWEKTDFNSPVGNIGHGSWKKAWEHRSPQRVIAGSQTSSFTSTCNHTCPLCLIWVPTWSYPLIMWLKHLFTRVTTHSCTPEPHGLCDEWRWSTVDVASCVRAAAHVRRCSGSAIITRPWTEAARESNITKRSHHTHTHCLQGQNKRSLETHPHHLGKCVYMCVCVYSGGLNQTVCDWDDAPAGLTVAQIWLSPHCRFLAVPSVLQDCQNEPCRVSGMLYG